MDDKRITGRAPSHREKKHIKKKLDVIISPSIPTLSLLIFILLLLKDFNAEIEDQFHTQKTFAVPDEDLQHKLREDAAAKLVPLYSKFLAMYADVPFSKNKGKHLRYFSFSLFYYNTLFYFHFFVCVSACLLPFNNIIIIDTQQKPWGTC